MRWLHTPDRSASFGLPHPRLLRWVRGYLVRDTSKLPDLPEAGHRNRYPANPYVSLIWLLQGQSIGLEPPDRAGRVLPPITLMGPQRRPWSTRNPAGVRSFGVVFMPDALSRLAGVDTAALVDQAVPAEQAFNPHWLAWCEAVRAAPTDAERVQRVEAFVRQALRVEAHASSSPSSPLSPRSLARRLKTLMGIGPRETQVLTRVERALVEARTRDADDAGQWADVAALGGYSDQAHLCRHTRRATGLSPSELARRTQAESDFWIYRVWEGAERVGAEQGP